jgi:hypothetical protein
LSPPLSRRDRSRFSDERSPALCTRVAGRQGHRSGSWYPALPSRGAAAPPLWPRAAQHARRRGLSHNGVVRDFSTPGWEPMPRHSIVTAVRGNFSNNTECIAASDAAMSAGLWLGYAPQAPKAARRPGHIGFRRTDVRVYEVSAETRLAPNAGGVLTFQRSCEPTREKPVGRRPRALGFGAAAQGSRRTFSLRIQAERPAGLKDGPATRRD